MRKTMLGSLTGLLIPFAAYAAPTGYGAYQRRQPAHIASHLSLSPVRQFSPPAERTADIDGGELAIFSGSSVKELVIIDAGVPDKALLGSATRAGIETVFLRAGEDALEQTVALLTNYRNLDAVHLVSHGEAGAILLGGRRIDKDTLEAQPQFLAALGAATRAGADLLLYACDLASEDSELLELIQQNSHLDIAASNDLTGAAELGGDWTLEIQTGNIEVAQAFSDKALKDFSALLRPFGTKTFETLTTEVYTVDPSIDFGDFVAYITSDDPEILNGTNAGACIDDLYINMLYRPPSQFYIRSDPSGESFGVTQLILRRANSSAATQVNIEGFTTIGETTSVVQKNGVSLLAAQAATTVDLTTGVTGSGSFNAVAKLRIMPVDNDAFCINSIMFTSPPVVTDARISISGASGTGGAYRIGDTVTATWNNTAGGDNNINPAITGVTVNFSQFGGDTAVAATNSSDTWTATYTIVSGAIDATNRNVSVTATNSAGNTTTADQTNASVDNIRPTAGIVVTDTALAAGETSLVTITFSEAVTGFTNADLTIANGSLSAVSSGDGGITWTATFTPTASITDATNIITLANTGVQDDAGNTGAGTTDSNNYAIDTARPTASIVVADTTLTASETSLVTITFSEAVTGFTNADLTIANGSLSAVSSSDGGITWTATLAPAASTNDPTNVITLANTGVQDAAGNAGIGTTDSNNYAINTAGPTSGIVVADTALGAGETSLVTITFSEAVTGFSNADLTIANGSLSAVSSGDGGITWTATFTPTAGITDASNVITLANTGVQNSGGNPGSGTTDSNNYAIDTARPTAGIVVADTALAAGETSLVTITFSEAVTGFANADLTIANGSLSAVSSGDGGITWTATLTPTAGITDASNVITLANTGVQDAAGNTGTGTTDSNNYAIDTARPTVGIVVADTALAAGETSLVTITFSEAVTGFSNADLTIANGSLSAVSSGDGGITWTATFTPTAGITDASNVITLAKTGVQDGAGNTGTGTTDSNNYAIDTARPTAGIVVTDTALAAGETSPVTITFSEAVTGFANADLTIANGTLSSVSTGDGGITWTATLTPTAGINDASNVITLANTGVQDAAGNTGTGTTDSNNYAIDTARPTAGIVVADTALAAGESSLVTITFSEAVTGFSNADLTIANGSLSAVSSGDGGITWTATLTPTAGITDASNVITLDNTGVQDAAGNAGTGTTDSNNYAVDTQAPAAPSVPDLAPESDTGISSTDNLTSDTTPTFTGTAEANSTVTLTSNLDGSLGSTTADGSGNWSLTSGLALSEATHDITAVAVDTAGNSSPASGALSITVDLTIPVEEPAIAAPADLDIDATGLYTTVTLRRLLGLAANASDAAVQAARLALASDVVDGANCCNPVALELNNGRIRLRPGTHAITWRATDSDGNTAEDTQTVNINPLVSFGMDQVGVEGGQVELRIFFNGLAPVYPLDVPYEIDIANSSAGVADHDLVDGIATFNSGETEVSVTINLAVDAPEGDEILVVRLGAGVNAGAADSQRITITEGNIAPTVVLSLEQNGVDTALVTPAGGTVTVMAMFDDQNADMPTAYDWSMSDAELIDGDGDVADAVFEFDPSALDPGVHRLHVAVGDGTATTTAALYFRVVTTLPNTGIDTGDADGDGIPDYLDDIDAGNVLPETAAQTGGYLIECDPGVRFRLGRHALLGSNGGARLTAGQLRAQNIEDDAGYRHMGGIFDFEVHELPVAGMSARVAIPLQAAIPAGAVYRKFNNGQWADFVVNGRNALHSAAGDSGYCPPPGDATWRSGLRAGYYCVRLTIEDGGPNDADGEANQSIADPGSVATLAADEEVTVYGVRSQGGGSADGFFLILLALAAVLRGRRVPQPLAGGLLLLLLPVQALAFDWNSLWADSTFELGFYQADGSRGSAEFSDGLAADGVSAEVQTYDVSRGARQLAYAWQYRERLALRLAYLDLGDVTVDLAADAASEEILSASLSRHYPASAAGLVLAGRYEYPLQGRFDLFFDAGIYRWDSDIDLSDANGGNIIADMGSGTDPILGLGANYRITERYAAGLNWQRVLFSGQEVALWGLSGVFSF